MIGICDICGREAVCELVSRGCAPVSYTACAECEERRAENIDVAALWIHMHGGGAVQDAYMTNLVSWVEGSYVGCPEIVSYYEKHKDSIIADLNEECVLVDCRDYPEFCALTW